MLHVTGGQLGIWWNREDIDDVLAEGGLSAEQRDRLKLVLAVRDFAFDELGLERSGCYSGYYDTGDGYVSYNVSASEKDAFAPQFWTFPFVGTIPYLGFFDLALATEEGQRLKAMGLDVLILPVPAYSTLGWFDDPVFSTMLDDDEAKLASTIIHELTHTTVWVPGDVELNENLASFVGDRGAELFFRARGGEDDPALKQAQVRRREQTLFNEAMSDLREELARVYEASGKRSAKLAFKERAIARFRKRYAKELRPQLSDDTYDWVLSDEIELNNAVLLAFRRYHGDEALLTALYERCGESLAAFVGVLQELAGEEDPRAALEALAAQSK
jgi:predicted aminopeptidase